mmetsp:Transcript_6768/g.23749  ORF Transcript_6768/g.23749 Transcript_6768/m.23749 type:complete len:220 (-) Transcript_6768:716-1375(-)
MPRVVAVLFLFSRKRRRRSARRRVSSRLRRRCASRVRVVLRGLSGVGIVFVVSVAGLLRPRPGVSAAGDGEERVVCIDGERKDGGPEIALCDERHRVSAPSRRCVRIRAHGAAGVCSDERRRSASPVHARDGCSRVVRDAPELQLAGRGPDANRALGRRDDEERRVALGSAAPRDGEEGRRRAEAHVDLADAQKVARLACVAERPDDDAAVAAARDDER